MISLDKMNLVMTVEYGKGVKGFESYYYMAHILIYEWQSV